MDNHFHLVVETPEANLSNAMRQLNGVYTPAFNHRHDRVGHVLQGRFKAIVVDRDSYLLELCRYVVLNPVRAKTTRKPDTYPWSSYQTTAGLAPTPAFLTVDWLLSQFGRQRPAAQRKYRAFVAEGLGRNPGSTSRGRCSWAASASSNILCRDSGTSAHSRRFHESNGLRPDLS
jgi:putative transposase